MSEIRNKINAMYKMIFAIPTAANTILVKPSTPAMSAMTRGSPNGAWIISTSAESGAYPS
jgi:hypothetical protein